MVRKSANRKVVWVRVPLPGPANIMPPSNIMYAIDGGSTMSKSKYTKEMLEEAAKDSLSVAGNEEDWNQYRIWRVSCSHQKDVDKV